MSIDIITQPKTFTLYGFSKIHDADKAYSTEMFELMDKVWAEVRAKQLDHKGINHVVYDCGNVVFAGIELITDDVEASLEKKQVTLRKYAYYKLIGPYSEIKNVYNNIQAKIEELGLTSSCPNMEIYGHWNEDESKLETEIYVSVE